MIKIAPSILSADYAHLADAIKLVEPVSDWLHVDVMDGHFVPNITIGPPVVKSIRGCTEMFLDCHLMIENPENYLEAFAKAGASGCSVHVEVGNTPALIEQMRSLGLEVGLAVNPDSEFDTYVDYLHELDYLLLMTVFPGFGGQSFISDVLPKIEKTHAYCEEHEITLPIQVDGGIDSTTGVSTAKAGARILVAGNAIFGQASPVEAAKAIRSAATEAIS